MTRLVSINARTAYDDPFPSEPEIVLMQFDHPELDAPLRLSSDPTVRISADPLVYGTRSSWHGADPAAEPFLFTLIALELPGDQEDAVHSARMVISNTSAELVGILRGVRTPPVLDMAVVLAGDIDTAEIEWRGLFVTGVEIDESQISVTATRRSLLDESWPAQRQTFDRFPGLFR